MDHKKDSQIVDFVEKLKSQKDLQEYAKAQFAALLQANKRIEALETENQTLKALIQSVSSTTRIVKSQEETTCELEISKIHAKALTRELSMEEVRKLEILVKTLYSAKEKSSEIPEANSRNVNPLSEQELLAIASNRSDDNGEM